MTASSPAAAWITPSSSSPTSRRRAWGCRSTPLAGIATTVWPPTGIALAALILRGPHLWPAVALGGARRQPHDRHPDLGRRDHRGRATRWRRWWARRLLKRFAFDPRLARLRDVLLLVGLAALASTLISATFGVAAAALASLHRAESYPVFWAVWWVGRRDGRPADRAADLRVGAADAAVAAPAALAGGPAARRWR